MPERCIISKFTACIVFQHMNLLAQIKSCCKPFVRRCLQLGETQDASPAQLTVACKATFKGSRIQVHCHHHVFGGNFVLLQPRIYHVFEFLLAHQSAYLMPALEHLCQDIFGPTGNHTHGRLGRLRLNIRGMRSVVSSGVSWGPGRYKPTNGLNSKSRDEEVGLLRISQFSTFFAERFHARRTRRYNLLESNRKSFT